MLESQGLAQAKERFQRYFADRGDIDAKAQSGPLRVYGPGLERLGEPRSLPGEPVQRRSAPGRFESGGESADFTVDAATCADQWISDMIRLLELRSNGGPMRDFMHE